MFQKKHSVVKNYKTFANFKTLSSPYRESATFYLRIIRYEKPDHAYRY